MARMKIELPEKWHFETDISVRITDLNYGDHLANQHLLTYAHEARVRYFKAFGLTELNFGGVALIQSDAAVIYKREAHYGECLKIQMTAEKEGRSAFNVYYQVLNEEQQQVAVMRTAIVCYDYEAKKVVAIPTKAEKSGFFK